MIAYGPPPAPPLELHAASSIVSIRNPIKTDAGLYANGIPWRMLRGCKVTYTPVTPAAKKLGFKPIVTAWCPAQRKGDV